MKALTNINAHSFADAVATASAAAARGQVFAFSGGGTDLLQQIKDGTNQADLLINLRTVREARTVSVSPAETLIGGLITLTELASHAALSGPWAGLREAAASVGTPQIRNVATLAGNVMQRPWCWYYRNGFPCFKAGGSQCFSFHGENQQHAIFGGGPSYSVHPSDLAPALVALNATFEVMGLGGLRRLSAAEFFVLPNQDPARENTLAATELLTGVRMPTPAAGVVSTYLKITSVASDRSRTFSARDIPSRCRSRPGRRTRDCPRVTAGQEWPQGPMTSAVVERADASGTGVSCATMH